MLRGFINKVGSLIKSSDKDPIAVKNGDSGRLIANNSLKVIKVSQQSSSVKP